MKRNSTAKKIYEQPNQELRGGYMADKETDISYSSLRHYRKKNLEKKGYVVKKSPSPSPKPKPVNPYPNVKSRYLETLSKDGAYGKDNKILTKPKLVPLQAAPSVHTRDKSVSRSQRTAGKDGIPVVYANLQGETNRY